MSVCVRAKHIHTHSVLVFLVFGTNNKEKTKMCVSLTNTIPLPPKKKQKKTLFNNNNNNNSPFYPIFIFILAG